MQRCTGVLGARRGRRSEPPEVHYPANPEHLGKPMRARASKLETEPLLRSLPVYRYREH